MKNRFLLLAVLAALVTLPVCAQTVFSYAVDTVYLSAGDSATLLTKTGRVFSVGDTVQANIWYVSDDSVNWHTLYDFDGKIVLGDSIMIDELPIHKYYWAALKAGAPVNNIVWRINNIVYKSLDVPVVTDDAGIGKTDILLLHYDSIRLFTTFDGLQSDTVVWYKDGLETMMPAKTSGDYWAVGYIYNRDGDIIDAVASDTYTINFVDPVEKVIFRSWAGSNDGNPRVTDTLQMEVCVCEIVLYTLVFSVQDPYKYEFVPVIYNFDKPYNFSYKWEYSGFAIVEEADSILQFNPIGFKHSGRYVFITTLHDGISTVDYMATPIRIVAYNVSNEVVEGDMNVYDGTIYSVTGAVVKQGVSGYYGDVVRGLNLPKGVYILCAGKDIYKFVK